MQARWGLTTAFGVLSLDQDGMFQVVVDHFVALLPGQVSTPGSAREAAWVRPSAPDLILDLGCGVFGFGEGPVERGDGGVLAGVPAGLDDQLPAIRGTGVPLFLRAMAKAITSPR